MIWRIPLVSLAILGVGAVLVYAQNAGMITVTVIDERGSPVQGAIVTMHQSTGGIGHHAIPDCVTDATGTCSRSNLALTGYTIRAMKPSAGYPNMSFEFYSHERHSQDGDRASPIEIELTQTSPAASATVPLRPKAAFLKPAVLDAISGAQLSSFTVLLRSVSDPKDFVGVGASQGETILVPPEEDVLVEITAPGYRTWRMVEHPADNGEGVLHLHSGDTSEITAQLVRQ